ncbi:MAG: hypothetical protein JKY74_14455 [Shewanella sp.]|nr:hypothetical protein [Shewanella sp.]
MDALQFSYFVARSNIVAELEPLMPLMPLMHDGRAEQDARAEEQLTATLR